MREDKIKARIIEDKGFWVGQVYGKWSIFYELTEKIGWGTVTEACLTKTGAKLALKRWKQSHIGTEFNL